MSEILSPFKSRTALKQILLCTLVFVGMAVPFKVMVLIEGLTEVRPVNAVPVVAGLLLGPAGAWGCALGNLIADFFGTFSKYSVLGFLANFIAAYLPYKLWHLWSNGERPNVKNFKNIGKYVLISLLTSLAVAIFIAGGMDVLFNFWSDRLFFIIFFNDLCFPLFLGLPVFIVLTCDDIKMEMTMPEFSLKNKGLKNGALLALALSLSSLFIMTCLGWSMSGNGLMGAAGVVFVLSVLVVMG